MNYFTKFTLLWSALLLTAVIPAGAAAEFKDLPQPARAVLARAAPCFEKKEYRRALDMLTTFQKDGGSNHNHDAPDSDGRRHPEIFFAIGNCCLLLERPAEAAEAYRSAVTLDAAHVDAWLNLARANYELKKYNSAAEAFFKAYEAEQDKDPQHLYFSAAAWLMAGEYQRSSDTFERLFKTHPAAVCPEWIEQLVNAFLAADRVRPALPYIAELARRHKGDKKVRWQEFLLHQYLRLNMHAEADAAACELIRQAPTAPVWWKALAHIRLNGGKNDAALAALMVYAYLTPLTDEETRLLADLQLQSGIPAEAAKTYAALLQKKPDGQVLQRLAAAYRLSGHPAEALHWIESQGKAAPDAELVLLKAELLYTLKRYPEAAANFRQAAQKGSDRRGGQAWLMAGHAFLLAGDNAASREAFRKAAGFPDQKKAAETALGQLKEMLGS